jgi:hypothetical protein
VGDDCTEHIGLVLINVTKWNLSICSKAFLNTFLILLPFLLLLA